MDQSDNSRSSFKTTNRVCLNGYYVQLTVIIQHNVGEKFTRFDYGHVDLNMKNYGTSEPPDYNMSLVTAPVYLIYGDNDPLVPPEVSSSI